MRHVHTLSHTLGPSGMGTVLLDVGGDVGALIIHASEEDLGREIEISRVDGDGVRTHAAVRRRDLFDGAIYSAMYPGLRAGCYVVWRDEDTPHGRVEVAGAAITELVWAPGVEYVSGEGPAAVPSPPA